MNPQKDFQAARGAGILLPYQARWVGDDSPVKVCEKSRRIGLSWGEAADCTLKAAQENGDDVWYIGYNKDMAREFIQDCADWSRYYELAASEAEEFVLEDGKKDIAAYRITFASGHRITALSSRPANLRGKQGIVVIDEAAFHDDLPGLIKAAMALLMWGGRVRIISTHNGDDNAFNDLVKDIREGKKTYSIHRIDLDQALEEGLYTRICQKLKREWSPEAEAQWRAQLIKDYGEDAQEELFCIPSKGGGTYLPRALVESCMTPDIPILRWRCQDAFAELPDHIRQAEAKDWCEEHLLPLLSNLDQGSSYYFGEDFGRTGDLTVIFPVERKQNLVCVPPFVVELRNVPFEEQKFILFYIVDRLPRFRAGSLDARGNGQYLAEVAMQKYGSGRIAQVMPSIEWYRENMPRYKAALEGRTVLLPKNDDILDDHRAVKMDKGVAKVPENHRGKGRDGGQRHGDSAIAGALAIHAVTSGGGGPIEYETVATRSLGIEEGGRFNGKGAW